MGRMRIGQLIVRSLCASLLVAAAAEAGDPVRGDPLFRITRNKNDNVVCYDVRQVGGKLDADSPVSVYWMIPSEKNKLETLTFLERKKAYGVNVVNAFGCDSIDIMLSAAKKPFRVTLRDSRWVALLTIDSLEVVVDSVFVMADESSTMPKVQWVEIMGYSPVTGESLRKRIAK